MISRFFIDRPIFANVIAIVTVILGLVTITRVKVTADLSLANVYVSSLEGSAGAKKLLGALQHAVPYLRHELAPRLGLREVPDLRFHYDESIERGARVEDLLRKIREGEAVEDDEEEKA